MLIQFLPLEFQRKHRYKLIRISEQIVKSWPPSDATSSDHWEHLFYEEYVNVMLVWFE